MSGRREDGRAEVVKVKGEWEMSKQRGSARRRMCGRAGGGEGRGWMDDSRVKPTTDVTRCSSSS